MALKLSAARILDFDIENRPLSYWYDGKCTAEITAIAWSWIGEDKVCCAMLGDVSFKEMLTRFLEAYRQADMVTGHYIRRHDLPNISGALLESGLPMLPAKLTSDTKCDLIRKGDIPTSQEDLAAYLGVLIPKKHMTQANWRAANRLEPDGLPLTFERVTLDVLQNKAIRAELLNRGLLGGPKIWKP